MDKILRFGVDVDGVLANFTYEVARISEQLWPGRLPPDYEPSDWYYTDVFSKADWREIWKQINLTWNFWLKMKAYPSNAGALRYFMYTQAAELYYVTSRAKTEGTSVLTQTAVWLETRLLGGSNSAVIPVPHSGNKKAVIEALELPFFLDDYDQTVRHLQDVPGLKAYVLDRPWNRAATDLPRVFSVEEYLNIVKAG